MSPEQAVRGAAGPVGRIGGAWMFDAETGRRGTELGLSTWSWYHCGRGGVLGDGDASVIVAAFGFFPPALQTKAWERGKAVLPPSQIAVRYAQACVAWGGRALPAEGAGRLAELSEAVADAAPIAGMPLFAGWRSLARSLGTTDGPGRLALALQVLREHRGSAHVVAVAATGVEPLQAVVSGRYGPSNAEFFGWAQPWPDPEAGKEAMARAEALTDELVRPAFAGLTDDERAELVTGLRALRV